MSGNAALSQILSSQSQIEVIRIDPHWNAAPGKRRVAAYVRVSSKSEEQEHSYAAQVREYSQRIANRDDWELVDIFADEGLTGTSMEKRDDFQRMLKACRNGEIDYIITKSVSRFSRNLTQCLKKARELKQLGVSVHFEREGIDTSTMTGETLLTLIALSAENESRQISQNMRWSYRARMKSGEFNTCCAPYGYRLVKNKLEVEPFEAKIVQFIYSSYLNGKGQREIASLLNLAGIHTRLGNQWAYNTIRYILKNKRYSGTAHLQKMVTTETLPFQRIRNKGAADQYIIENANPVIIPVEQYEAVQKLNESRRIPCMFNQSSHPLSRKMVCGVCGSVLKHKIANGKPYWVCQRHDADKRLCPMPRIPESEVHAAFIRLYHKLKTYSEEILHPMLKSMEMLRRRQRINNQKASEIRDQILDLSERSRMLHGLMSKGILDSAHFITQADGLTEEIGRLKRKKRRLMEEDGDNEAAAADELIDLIEDGPDRLDEFEPELFDRMVKAILARPEKRLVFQFICGLELEERWEE